MSDTDKYAEEYPSICAAVKEARESGYRGEISVDPDEAEDLLADLDAANAHIKELEAERLALTLRNDELQRMVDLGLERSSTAAREAVKP